MTIQEKFPSIRPSLNLDFANTKTLYPRVTFSRASTATYYDGKTVAKAEENLLLYSQEFDKAAWVKTGIAVTANNEVAPDGTTTAETITATADNATITQAVTVIATEHQYSIYLKRKTGEGVVEIQSVAGAWTAVTLTTSWQRFNVAASPTTGSRTSGVRIATLGDEIVVWGAQLEQRSQATAYTPTTTQPITNYVPVLRTAAANVARFDHDPVTGESLGLLIEEQRTNLLTYSEQFDNAAWLESNSVVTANAVVAPDGTLSADALIETASNSQHALYRANGFKVSTTKGQIFSVSAFVKASGCSIVLLGVSSQPSYSAVHFDVVNGTVVRSSFITSDLYIANSAKITSVGAGWFLISASFSTETTTETAPLIKLNRVNSTSQNPSYTGDGTSGIYIWGAQLEAGAFPTSYIKTEASQVTRIADSAVMTGTNFSSWFRQNEGSFCAEFSVNALRQAMIFSSGNRGIGIQPDGRIQVGVYNSGDRTSPQAIVTAVGNPYKVALVHDSKEMGGYGYSGSFVSGKSSNYIVPTNTSLVLGTQGTERWLNGHIRKIAYYPQRLSNTQLQALTS